MWHEMFNFFTLALSVALCSAAVKLIDDFLDKDIDFHAGRKNWAESVGVGSIVYAALFLAFAAALDAQVALSLFLACCIVGMFNSLGQRLPSKLNGWQESIVIFAIAVFFFGINQMLFALCFILAIQLIDDCIDFRLDKLSGHRNLAHRFGILECLLAGLLGFLAAWSLNEQLIIPALVGSGIVYIISFRNQGVQLW